MGGTRIEILTDYERRVWKESAIELLEHPSKMFSSDSFATNRLRYEKTLRERDIDVAECNLILGVAKEHLAQALATLQAKDAQIAALVTALRYIKGMTVCDVLGDRFARAQQAAIAAIKKATND